jgi:hypothetical protein
MNCLPNSRSRQLPINIKKNNRQKASKGLKINNPALIKQYLIT